MSILPAKSRVVGVGLVEFMDFDEERFVFLSLSLFFFSSVFLFVCEAFFMFTLLMMSQVDCRCR